MLSAFIEDNVTPILMGLGTALGLYAGLTIAANAAKIAEVAVTVAKTVAMLALIGPLAIVALGLTALASPLGIFAVVALSLAGIFKVLYDNGFTFGSVLQAMGDNLKRFGLFYVDIWLSIAEKIAGFFGKGDAIKAARARIADERKELDDREAARDKNRVLTAAAREQEKEKNANEREKNKLGKKEIADKKAILDEKNKLDTNAGPEALLKQFAVKEGSSLIPKNKEPATAKAEVTKKEIEKKGEEKTAAEKKAADEKAKAEEKSKEDSKKEPPSKPATQESAESLLASLNTKMTELIKINKGTQAVNEQQLSVQKGMTSDLFAA
jgi:hypothetical protein